MLIIDAEHGTPPLDALRAACRTRLQQPGIEPRFVVIDRGRRREGRTQSAELVTMDGNVMNRQSFLRAVALAAGQAPEGSEVQGGPAPGLIGAAAALPMTPLSRTLTLPQECLILVAEDNETNQKVILHQLGLLGYTADVACNGREALERWQSGNYALLLTDLHMPEMDGYELSRAIRSSEVGQQHMPIVALTANAIKGEAERCLAAGMNGYLSKPAQLADLQAMLQDWLPEATTARPLPPLAAPATPTALTDAAPVPVDVSVLKTLVGDDSAIVDEFLREFRLDASGIAAELRSACEAGQARASTAAAHKLKSSARAVGALALGELCDAMEQAGKTGQVEVLTVLLPRFQTEMAAVDEFLGALLGSEPKTTELWPDRPLARSATDEGQPCSKNLRSAF